MYSADERDEFTRSGARPGWNVDQTFALGMRRPARTPRRRLVALAIVMAVLAVIGLVNLAAPGIPHWYTYARSALALVAALLFFAVARATRPTPWLVGLAIAGAVVRLLLDVSVYAILSTSWTATVIYAIALPAVVTVYAIVAVTLVAKEHAAQQAPIVR